MKILVAGNLANTGYYLTSKLRDNGMSVDLLTDEKSEIMNDPKSTGELKNNIYPNWIKFLKKEKINWKWNTIQIMRKYDLVLAATEFPIFSLFSLKPFIAIATGSDLRELAKSNSLKGILLRLAYKKAKIVIFTDPDLLKSVKLLKLHNAIYLPPVRDLSKISIEELSYNNERFVFFHPTNHIWNVKQNDLFIKSYIKLAKKKNNIFLILINKGKDFEKSLALLRESKIEDKFAVLPKPLNQKELMSYYQRCDVVVDQFKIGSLGSIGLESMNFSKPVIAYIDKDIYKTLYGEIPPILTSKNETELLMILEKLVDDQDFTKKIGKKSKEWIKKFHSSDSVIKNYILILQCILDGKSQNEIMKFSEITKQIFQ